MAVLLNARLSCYLRHQLTKQHKFQCQTLGSLESSVPCPPYSTNGKFRVGSDHYQIVGKSFDYQASNLWVSQPNKTGSDRVRAIHTWFEPYPSLLIEYRLEDSHLSLSTLYMSTVMYNLLCHSYLKYSLMYRSYSMIYRCV